MQQQKEKEEKEKKNGDGKKNGPKRKHQVAFDDDDDDDEMEEAGTTPRDKTPKKSKRHCHFFWKGNCKNGDDCLFRHDLNGPRVSKKPNEAHTLNKKKASAKQQSKKQPEGTKGSNGKQNRGKK